MKYLLCDLRYSCDEDVYVVFLACGTIILISRYHSFKESYFLDLQPIQVSAYKPTLCHNREQ